jgi:hypothetical protein
MSEYVQALAEDRRRREAWMGRWVAAAGEPDRDAMERARRALGVEDQHAARRRRAS